jgi:flagellar protein FliO/FliZ
MGTDIPTLLTAVVALGAVLGLVVLAGRIARVGGFAPRRSGLQVLAVQETVALDARRRLHLIRCGERQVLLLTGGSQDVVVGWVADPPSEISSQASDTGRTP